MNSIRSIEGGEIEKHEESIRGVDLFRDSAVGT